MKSLIAIVNTTPETIVRFGIDFPPGAPVIVYRDRSILDLGEQFGRLIGDLSAGSLVGFDFDGNANSPAESVETLNALANQWIDCKAAPAFSPLYYWYKAGAADLLDGLRRQIVVFDWTDPDVSVDLSATLERIGPAVTYLSAGFVDLANVIIQNTTPDGEADFLSPARLSKFRAIFATASK